MMSVINESLRQLLLRSLRSASPTLEPAILWSFSFCINGWNWFWIRHWRCVTGKAQHSQLHYLHSDYSCNLWLCGFSVFSAFLVWIVCLFVCLFVVLVELVQKASKDDSRDFLFYLAVANYRLKVSGTCFFSVQVYGRQNEETDLQKSLLLYHAAFDLQIRERAKVKSDRQSKIFLSLPLPLTSCSSLKACHLTHWFAFTEGFSNWSNPKVLLRHGYIH